MKVRIKGIDKNNNLFGVVFMELILFIGGCLTVIAIILVFLLNANFPQKKFMKYLPSIVFIVAGIVLVPASLLGGRWTGVGVGLLGLLAFVLGIVILLIAVIIDTASKK